MAARIANTTGEVFANVVQNELEISNGGPNSPVQIRTVDSAAVPEPHPGSHYISNSTIGRSVGISLGIGRAGARNLLDTRVHTAQELELVTSLPVTARTHNGAGTGPRPL